VALTVDERFVPKAVIELNTVGAPWTIADQGPLVEENRLSDVDLLGDLDGIIHFDAEVTDRALDLRMPKQKLDGA
jgi:hypothetical protein